MLFRKVKNIDIPTFEQALRRSTLFTNPASTADSFADQLADVVSAELDLVAPLKTCLWRQSKPSTKWFPKEAADAKRERRRLEGVWKRHGRELNYVEYHRSCRLATKLINESRRKNHQRQLAECTNSDKMWGVAKKLCTLLTVTRLGPTIKITPLAPLSPNSSLQKSRISSTPFRLKCHPLHLQVNIPIVHSQVTQSRIFYQSHQMRYPSFFSLLPPNPPVKILYPLHL